MSASVGKGKTRSGENASRIFYSLLSFFHILRLPQKRTKQWKRKKIGRGCGRGKGKRNKGKEKEEWLDRGKIERNSSSAGCLVFPVNCCG